MPILPVLFWKNKNHIFQKRNVDKIPADELVHVTPDDAEILSLPGMDPTFTDGPNKGQGKVFTWLRDHASYMQLNLMDIRLQGGTKLHPSQYHKLQPDGAVMATAVNVFPMFERVEGGKNQIGVPVFQNLTNVITNGRPRVSNVAVVDVSEALRALKRSRTH